MTVVVNNWFQFLVLYMSTWLRYSVSPLYHIASNSTSNYCLILYYYSLSLSLPVSLLGVGYGVGCRMNRIHALLLLLLLLLLKGLYEEAQIRKNLAWKSKLPRGRGLYNAGSTCFLNATLQCLAHLPPLAQHFLDTNYSKVSKRALSPSTYIHTYI